MFENSPLTKEEILEEFGEIGKKVRGHIQVLESLKEQYVFEYTDLKLRDLSYELYKRVNRGELTEKESYTSFNIFADVKKECFLDFLNEAELITDPLGRTSRFRVLPSHAHRDVVKLFTKDRSPTVEEIYDEIDASLVGTGLVDSLLGLSKYGEFTSIAQISRVLERDYIPYHSSLEEHIYEIDVIIEEFSNVIDYFAEELIGLIKKLNNVRYAYGYIEEFKRRQIELYDDYVQSNEILKRIGDE